MKPISLLTDAAKKGRYFYRFKLSPDPLREDTKRDLNMQKLTRQMMLRLEKRVKTPIPWAGALHDDHTDIRHVHILAAIPRRLKKYELEALIREASTICREQRRERERGSERTSWRPLSRTARSAQSVTMGKRLVQSSERRAQESSYLLAGRGVVKPPPTCTCPRCHFPQSHARHGHSCVSCGKILHKKRELALQRKGRAWERSL